MAVQTTFDITFQCGHTEQRDLSDRPAGKRKSFANWLSQQDECSACWRENNRDKINEKRREAALQNQKALDLPDLEGSEAQLEWAPIFRNNMVMNAHEELVRGDNAAMTEEQFEERVLDPARKIVNAGWWMDNVDAEPEDLEELVTTALDDAVAGTVNENPF